MAEPVRQIGPDEACQSAQGGLAEWLAADSPVVLKGLACTWPLVVAGLDSPVRAANYLKSFYSGKPVVGYTGSPEIGGRFFYDDSLAAMNFAAARVPLDDYLDRILGHLLCRVHRRRHLSAWPARGERAPPR